MTNVQTVVDVLEQLKAGNILLTKEGKEKLEMIMDNPYSAVYSENEETNEYSLSRDTRNKASTIG